MEKKGREERRKLGQFYTPSWVVDYIVKHTLGRSIREQEGRHISEFSVLDPACGDGAFLLEALRLLVDQARKRGESHTSLRSLADTIHGVDVDPQAVDQCRHNLTKAAEEMLGYPVDFSRRILLGNSLIQEDDDAKSLFGNELSGWKPLNWYQAFPWAMREGGFDIIIGNPPFIGNKAIPPKFKEYLRRRFGTVESQFDILVPFMERALQLLRPGGRLGFLISNKLLASDYGRPLRRLLLSSFTIEQMVDLSHLEVFRDAATYPHIIILRKPLNPGKVKENTILVLPQLQSPKDLEEPSNTFKVPQRLYSQLPGMPLSPLLSPARFRLLIRLHRGTVPLGRLCTIRCGIATPGFSSHILTSSQIHKLPPLIKDNLHPFLTSGDIQRYTIRRDKYLPYNLKLASEEQWNDFRQTKIVISGMGRHLRAALDLHGCALGRVYYITQKNSSLPLHYLLALLNSSLLDAYYTLLYEATHLRGGHLRYNSTYLERLPIRRPTKSEQNEIINLVQELMEAPQERRQPIDEHIDRQVASLYGLSPREIRQLQCIPPTRPKTS